MTPSALRFVAYFAGRIFDLNPLITTTVGPTFPSHHFVCFSSSNKLTEQDKCDLECFVVWMDEFD
jgi:hypothetical protein